MFQKIFGGLLAENGLNRKKFAEKSGIPYPTVIGWTNLGRMPDYEALIKVADFFQCSIDYLTGRQDDFGNISCNPDLSPEERRLLGDYRRLGTDDRQLVLGLTKRLAGQ